MSTLPTVVASSVIRSSHQGESHGGLYLVDMETERCKMVVDWDDQTIDWSGRGFDRGLRGIAIYEDRVYVAASDEIFVFDSSFNLLAGYRNAYLRHCHEIHVADGRLLVSSTGYDSVLEFDLSALSFVRGWCLRLEGLRSAATWLSRKTQRPRLAVGTKPTLRLFDPLSADGPEPGDTVHINMVRSVDGRFFVATKRVPYVLEVVKDRLVAYGSIPFATHNAMPYGEGVLLNDTASDRVIRSDRRGRVLSAHPIKRYSDADLEAADLPQDHARQAFGRGLCLAGESLIVGGSSPATVSVYTDGQTEALKTVNITMDVRNTIHGLEIFPWPIPDDVSSAPASTLAPQAEG